LDGWPGDRPLLIGLAGGSGSGKTTVADALVNALEEILLIQHDAYYRHRSDLSYEERTRVNYDHPDSLETELLIAHLEELRAGRSVRRPVYDFQARHHRERSDGRVGAGPIREHGAAYAPRVRRTVQTLCRPHHPGGLQRRGGAYRRRDDPGSGAVTGFGRETQTGPGLELSSKRPEGWRVRPSVRIQVAN